MELEPAWNRLLAKTGNDALHMNWPFMVSWLRQFGSTVQPQVIAVIRDGDIVGIAPVMLCSVRSRFGLSYRQLRFLCEGGETSYDYLDFLTSPEIDREVRETISTLLRSLVFDSLELRYTRNPDLLPASMATRQSAGVSAVARLPERWEAFLASRPKGLRHNLRHYNNRSAGKYEFEYWRVPDQISLEDGITQLIALNHQRWQEKGQSFRTPGYIQLHRDIMVAMLTQNRLWLTFLTIGGRPISANYSISCQGILYMLQMGRNPEFDYYGVGHQLIARIFQEAIAQRLQKVDFFPGASFYKTIWSDQEIPVFHYSGQGGGWRALALRAENRFREIYHRLKAVRAGHPADDQKQGKTTKPPAPGSPAGQTPDPRSRNARS